MNFGSLYSEKVLEHFRNPRNVGEIKDADGVATVGNRVCGDVMRLFIKVGKKKGKEYIQDAKFQTLGCGAAVATTSVLTEMVKGKSLRQAEKVTNKAVVDALGGLPSSKIHCSLLAEEALKKAIDDYQKRKRRNS